MLEYFTMDSFGADCPGNWPEICDYLNAELTARLDAAGLDAADPDAREIADAIFDAYTHGDYKDAPAPRGND